MRKAIERSEIEVVFQPIARLADTQLAGFEALMRWRHRTEGLLGPEFFIALAEETGIIKDLNRHVLNEAARQLGIWQRAFRPEKPLFRVGERVVRPAARTPTWSKTCAPCLAERISSRERSSSN